MEDFYESESDFYKDEPKFEGVNWNGLILAPLLQFLILLLPHISNFIKERQLRRHLVATKGRKEELLQLKKELSKISMTDEFARHAKLQRRINAIQDLLRIADRQSSAHDHVSSIDAAFCTSRPVVCV